MSDFIERHTEYRGDAVFLNVRNKEEFFGAFFARKL